MPLPFASFDLARFAVDIRAGLNFRQGDDSLRDALIETFAFNTEDVEAIDPPPSRPSEPPRPTLMVGLPDRDFRHRGVVITVIGNATCAITWRCGERHLFWIERFTQPGAPPNLQVVASSVEAQLLACALDSVPGRTVVRTVALERDGGLTLLLGPPVATAPLLLSLLAEGYRLVSLDALVVDAEARVWPLPRPVPVGPAIRANVTQLRPGTALAFTPVLRRALPAASEVMHHPFPARVDTVVALVPADRRPAAPLSVDEGRRRTLSCAAPTAPEQLADLLASARFFEAGRQSAFAMLRAS